MADKDTNRQGPLSKVLQKRVGRAKERILQNLGKADRTTDVDFDVCVKNINKLQIGVTRLQKEFKNYYQCLRALQASRKSLMDTVNELYEPYWGEVDNFNNKSEVLNQNFEEFCEKLNNQLLTPVSSYISQFPEMNNKIAKRNRKLLDYDNCRHNLQNIETVKKREEGRIVKAKEQLDKARNLFEVINSELHDEIPALYDSRISFFVSNLQCLYLAEAHFHNQDATVFLELNSILESVAEANNKLGNERAKMSAIESQPDCERNSYEREEETSSGSASGDAIFRTPPTTAVRQFQHHGHGGGDDFSIKCSENSQIEKNGVSLDDTVTTSEGNGVLHQNSQVENRGVPLGETAAPLRSENSVQTAEGHRFLYQVKGTYKYVAEDADELSFNVDDVIDVVAYDDPEEQEEGWLMGVFNGKKGLFPANFTSRI